MLGETGEIPGDYQFKALHQGPAIQRFWHRNKFQALSAALGTPRLDLVVDLGCGSGNLLFWGGLRATRAIGFDASFGAVRFCVDQRGDRPASFAQALGGALPLAESVADLVLLVEVIEHLTEPDAVLREILRVLRPGGRLFLTTPNYQWPSAWPLLEWLADKSGKVAQMRDAQHVQRFSPASLRDIVERNGFRVDRLGTMYRWSPLAALVSADWADRAAASEIARGIRHGSLIHCLASKPLA
jgi:SAM-dependent methyltransferase